MAGKKKAPNKHTSEEAAEAGSKVLRDKQTGADSKTAAGSALSQARSGKHTSEEAAEAASKVLRDGRTAEDSKTAAGSALSQKAPEKKA
ncbi:MAG: hypothetical protein ACR2M0_15705 [Chloroflexia bacterium]